MGLHGCTNIGKNVADKNMMEMRAREFLIVLIIAFSMLPNEMNVLGISSRLGVI